MISLEKSQNTAEFLNGDLKGRSLKVGPNLYFGVSFRNQGPDF